MPRDLTEATEKDIAELALVMAAPAIEAAIEADLTNDIDFFVEVCIIGETTKTHKKVLVLKAQRTFGTPKHWKYKYHVIARQKGEITLRTGRTARDVKQNHPGLSRHDDGRWWGNATDGRWVIDGSGFSQELDEMFCVMVLAAIHGLEAEKLRQLEARASETNDDQLTYEG